MFNQFLPSDNGNNQYLLFDHDTDGRCGRKVYMDGSLVGKYIDIVSRSDNPELVAHGIKQLRAKAGGITSFSAVGSAHEHMDEIAHVAVTYYILQAQAYYDLNGVVITKIADARYDGKEKPPGNYHIPFDEGAWNAKVGDKPTEELLSSKIAINGMVPSYMEAANRIMPEMVEAAYGDAKAQGYIFGYQPQLAFKDMRLWTSPEQKQTNLNVQSMRIAKFMRLHKNKPTQWMVHGDGIVVFEKALNMLSGEQLKNMEVLFVAPEKVAVGAVLPAMKRAGIKLHNDIMKTNTHDWLSLENRLQLKGFQKHMKSYGPEYAARTRELKYDAKRDRAAVKKFASMAAGMGFGIPTAVKAASTVSLAALSPSVTMGAVCAAFGGAVLAAPAMMQQARMWRNILSSHVNNPSLNPHMHPFKGVSAFNSHVEGAHGGEFKSFLALVKSLGG